MAPSLGPNTIQPVAALSSTASASSSIYSRLDAHTLLRLRAHAQSRGGSRPCKAPVARHMNAADYDSATDQTIT